MNDIRRLTSPLSRQSNFGCLAKSGTLVSANQNNDKTALRHAPGRFFVSWTAGGSTFSLRGRSLAPPLMTTTIERRRLITSRNDHRVKQIRALQTRSARDSSKTCFIEGVRFVGQALQQHVKLETLVVAPDLLTHPSGRKLVQQQVQAGTPCLEVTPEVFHSLALSDEPQGIGAVVRQRWMSLERADPRAGLCWIALEAIHSPGNLGTILRTSEAVGAAGLIIIGPEIDPYDPATVRATMGCTFAQRFVRTDMPSFMAWKQRHRCTLVGTSPQGQIDYHRFNYPSPLVLFMGGERKGLPPESQALCDVMVHIPMVGRVDSLNLAIASGIVLYEVFNQQRAMTHLELAN
jgi:TrmH family RNA methyltransferase